MEGGIRCRNIAKAARKMGLTTSPIPKNNPDARNLSQVCPAGSQREKSSSKVLCERSRRFGSRGRHAGTLTETLVEKSAEMAQKILRRSLFEATKHAWVSLGTFGRTRLLRLRIFRHEKMGSSPFSIAGQRGVAGMDLLEGGFSHSDLAGPDLGASRDGWRRDFWRRARAIWSELCGGGSFFAFLGSGFLPVGCVRLSFVGLFFNNFLVGAVGGDAVKVVWLAAKGHRKTAALLSVLMDRMSGFGALILCSLIFMLWRLDWLMRSAVVAGLIKRRIRLSCSRLWCCMAFSFLMSAKGLHQSLAASVFPAAK